MRHLSVYLVHGTCTWHACTRHVNVLIKLLFLFFAWAICSANWCSIGRAFISLFSQIPPLSAAGLVVLLLPYLDYYYAGMLGIPLAYHNSSTKCLHIKVGHSGHIRSSSACEGQPVACSPINTPNLHLFIYYCQLVLIRTKKSAVHSAQLSIMLYNKQQLVSFMLKKKQNLSWRW